MIKSLYTHVIMYVRGEAYKESLTEQDKNRLIHSIMCISSKVEKLTFRDKMMKTGRDVHSC